jgi:uncharacterized protein (DUF1499 family)
MKPLLLLVGLALALAVVSLLAAAGSGFGHRLQLWSYATGFRILGIAVIGAGISVLLAVIGIVVAWRGGHSPALYAGAVALVLGLIVAVPPLTWLRTARQLPYIHDITTDTENPPAFVALLPERANAPNGAEYGGPAIAAQQRRAYPDIEPLHLAVSPRQAFEAALATARALGWRIVAADAEAGRIEASDRTFWYGFIDDVVVRVTGASGGARVDVRSVSRVGKSDIGANARRIRSFLAALEAEVARRARSAGQG